MTPRTTAVVPTPSDAARLLRAIAQRDDRGVDDELRRWLRGGFAQALAALEALPGADGTRTNDLCCRLVRLFVAADPWRARDELITAYGSPLPRAIVDTYYGTLAACRPFAEVAAAVAALDDTAEQQGAARPLLAAWGREAPEAALAWSRSHRAALDDDAIGALVQAVAVTAPRAALDLLVEQEGTFASAIHWEMQMSEIVAHNATPANALDWLLWGAGQPLGPTAWNNLVRQLFARVRDEDPATALGFAQQVVDPHLRDALLSASARARWVTDYGASHGAVALAALFDDPVHQAEAVTHYITTLASPQTRQITAQIQTLPAGPLKNAAILAALPALARHEPTSVTELLREISGPAELRRQLTREAFAVVDAVVPVAPGPRP